MPEWRKCARGGSHEGEGWGYSWITLYPAHKPIIPLLARHGVEPEAIPLLLKIGLSPKLWTHLKIAIMREEVCHATTTTLHETVQGRSFAVGRPGGVFWRRGESSARS